MAVTSENLFGSIARLFSFNLGLVQCLCKLSLEILSLLDFLFFADLIAPITCALSIKSRSINTLIYTCNVTRLKATMEAHLKLTKYILKKPAGE